MKTTITVEEAGEKQIQGNYHELHNIDWNEKIRLMLDDANDVEEEIRQDKVKDHADAQRVGT